MRALTGATFDRAEAPTELKAVEETDPTQKDAEEKESVETEDDRVRTIIRQIDEEIRVSAREQVRQEEERKRRYLLKSKGPFDTNPVSVAFLRDVATGDTIQKMDTLDLEGRRILQSTSSVIQKSRDVEERKSPTASPHSEEV